MSSIDPTESEMLFGDAVFLFAKKLMGEPTAQMVITPLLKMSDTLGTTVNLVKKEALTPILTPFGLTYESLMEFLRDTSAVLVGGAVTHYLWNAEHEGLETPVPGPKSDLDFWIYAPKDSNKGTGYQHYYVFRSLVLAKVTEFFKSIGFARSRDLENAYNEAKVQFRTKARIEIEVLWFENVETGRYFNLVFTDSLPSPMMMKTDIPIGRAMIYYRNRNVAGECHEELMVEYDPLVLQNIRSLQLTAPDPRYAGAATEKRVAKYLERYGMTLAPFVDPFAVDPFAAYTSAPSLPAHQQVFPPSGGIPLNPFGVPVSAPPAPAPLQVPNNFNPFGGPVGLPPAPAPLVVSNNCLSYAEATPVSPDSKSLFSYTTPPRGPSSLPPGAPLRRGRQGFSLGLGHADEDLMVGPDHPIFGLNPRFLPVVPTFAEKDFSSAKPPAL